MPLRRPKTNSVMASKELKAAEAIKISPELSERANKIINEFISLGGKPIVSINNKSADLDYYKEPDIYFTVSCYQDLEKWYYQRWVDNPSRIGYTFADGMRLNPFEAAVKEILGYRFDSDEVVDFRG